MSAIVKSKESFRIDLRVVFYQESGFWVAHCLEMDVLGHGVNKEEAMEVLADAIVTQMEQSMQNDNPANMIQLADRKYFEMYFSGKDIGEVACIVKQVQRAARHSGNIQVDEITGRVFSRTPALA